MKQEFIRVPTQVAKATNMGDLFTVKGEKYEVKSVRRGAESALELKSEIELIKTDEEETVELDKDEVLEELKNDRPHL